MKNQMIKKQDWNYLFFSVMLIGIVFLVGCAKEPNSPIKTNIPVTLVDLSLNSYIAVGGDTFRGAYNSILLDSTYGYRKPYKVFDSKFNSFDGYTYTKHMIITWYGSNKNGSSPKDTFISINFRKRIADTQELNSNDISMYFDSGFMNRIENRIYGVRNFFNDDGYADEIGQEADLPGAYVHGNWGTENNVFSDMLICFSDCTLRKTSFKQLMLVDGKLHRVFESEYYSAVHLLMNLKPVTVRIVLD